MNADVIVVGAGLSGLKAASLLAAAGRRVIVLEARDRIGGRLERGVLCGRAIDRGAHWVGPRHARVLAEARRFGMETSLQFADGRNILSLNGRRHEFFGDVPNLPSLGLVEIAMLRRRWAKEAAMLGAGTPRMAAKARQWDAQTLETWIGKNMSTVASAAFARLVPHLLFGAGAQDISYLWMVERLRAQDGLEHALNVKGGARDAKFKGGAYRLAERLASELDGRIVLGAPVQAVSQDESSVAVRTTTETFHAARVVIALAPHLCARIEIDALSPQRRMLMQRMPQTPAMVFHMVYDSPFWREAGYSGQVWGSDLPLTLVFEDTVEDAAPMLIGLALGASALSLSAMSGEGRRNIVTSCLESLFGPRAGDIEGFDEKDWSADAWAGGFVGFMAPGALTQFGEALRAPCGRVHWAGTEAAVQWSGSMEGALESGERAAREILAAG